MLLKKKKTGLSFEKPVPEFIPAATMWDKHTVLTKNGELLQTIKVTGFTHESIGSEILDLRNTLRNAIRDNIGSDKFAVWIHTVRRVCNLDPGGDFPEYLSRNVNESWRNLNDWQNQYINEVYLTILIEGRAASVVDIASFIRSLYFNSYYKSHTTQLEEQIVSLYTVTDGILKALSGFGARRLGLHRHEDIYYSEYLRFFGKIMNLADKPIPLDTADMAQQLASHKLAFGYNTFETVGAEGKHFGCAFIVKEYHEMGLSTLDVLIQAPMQFIITQTLDFVNGKQVLADYEDQYSILKQSEADHLLEISGLDEIIETKSTSLTDFGEGQISLVLFNDDLRNLDKDIARIQESFEEIGMVAPRLDVGLEDVYWSQLPGNFSFLKYQKNINTGKVAGLASLFNFPAGQRFDNPWGNATTMFHTADNTPYFFSFHHENNGHTVAIGMDDSGKTVLVNFLLSESRKHRTTIFVLDHKSHSEVFLCALNGEYTYIDSKPDQDSVLYDLFNYASETEEEDLIDFLTALVSYDPVEFGLSLGKKVYRASYDKPTEEEEEIPVLTEPDMDLIEATVRHIRSLPSELQNITSVAEYFKEHGKRDYYLNIAPYLKGREYEGLFSSKRKETYANIQGFEMTALKQVGRPALAATALMLHECERMMYGQPTILVIDEAWDLVNKRYFAARLKPWLQRMRKKNTVVIFATDNFSDKRTSTMTSDIAAEVATRFFLPNPRAEEYTRAYQEVWQLSDEEFSMLKDMESAGRQFLLRKGADAIVCSLNLKQMLEISLLSGSKKKSELMYRLRKELGSHPEKWVRAFCEQADNGTKSLGDL